MIFTQNPDGTYTVTLDASEIAGVTTIATVRQIPATEVLRAAATQVTQALAQTVADLRAETVREVYRRIGAMPTDQLVGLLNAAVLPPTPKVGA